MVSCERLFASSLRRGSARDFTICAGPFLVKGAESGCLSVSQALFVAQRGFSLGYLGAGFWGMCIMGLIWRKDMSL